MQIQRASWNPQKNSSNANEFEGSSGKIAGTIGFEMQKIPDNLHGNTSQSQHRQSITLVNIKRRLSTFDSLRMPLKQLNGNALNGIDQNYTGIGKHIHSLRGSRVVDAKSIPMNLSYYDERANADNASSDSEDNSDNRSQSNVSDATSFYSIDDGSNEIYFDFTQMDQFSVRQSRTISPEKQSNLNNSQQAFSIKNQLKELEEQHSQPQNMRKISAYSTYSLSPRQNITTQSPSTDQSTTVNDSMRLDEKFIDRKTDINNSSMLSSSSQDRRKNNPQVHQSWLTNSTRIEDSADQSKEMKVSKRNKITNFRMLQSITEHSQSESDITADRSTKDSYELPTIPAANSSASSLNPLSETVSKSSRQYSQQFASNRVIEIKRTYKSPLDPSKKNVLKQMTFNLTFILKCEIQKNKVSRIAFEVILFWSTLLRYYFYLFSVYMIFTNGQYLHYLLPMMVIPRVVTMLSIFQAVFSYENHTKSYRQVSQIFNSAFINGDYFQVMNMNQLLTSDSFEQLSRERIIERIKFILMPPEINVFMLRGTQVAKSKKRDAWYASNFILISIEFVSTYMIMVIFSVKNKIFEDEFREGQRWSLNLFTISCFVFFISLVAFFLFSLFYLRKGNLKLRKDNNSNGLRVRNS